MTMAATSTLPGVGSDHLKRIVLYAPHNHLVARLAAIPGLEGVSWIDSRELTPQQLLHDHRDVQLLLLDYTGANTGYSQSMAQALCQQHAPPPMLGIGTIAEGPQQSIQLLAAIRAGVRDFIDLGAPSADIQDILRRVHRDMRSSQPITVSGVPAQPVRAEGKLTLLLGVRPGVGTSTLAVHLASRLAAATATASAPEDHMLLLDLGFPAADAALYLGVEGGFDLDDALRSINRIDATFAASAVSRHSSGLSVLARTSSTFAGEETAALVQRLRGLYGHVLCDLGGTDFASIPTTLLARAQEIWLVTDQSIGALLSLDRCLQALEQRGQRDERLQLVLNRYDDGFGITPEQVAARFCLPLLGTLPERSRPLRSAASIGRLLHEQHPGDPYLTALQALSQRLSSSCKAPATTGALSRLAHYMSPSKWKRN
jgi:pilus assembly protein CpaE